MLRACRLFLIACLLGVPLEGQKRPGGIDFLNERLPIPNSERFKEGDYIDSGVGLTFGVDRRLSYLAGNYEEAVERFELAISGFRYRSEIWVYLARAYFYMKSPEEARRTIERAAQVMPDLNEKFWNPLMESMLGEIRKRAYNLQTQVDFYSKNQEDFLSLFRLYRFLDDERGSIGVIHSADAKANKMNELSGMVSAGNQRLYQKEVGKWQQLADQLRAEMIAVGIQVPPAPRLGSAAESTPTGQDGKDPELLERTRILQLKVDFYLSAAQDYRDLFDNYLQLDMPEKAAGVIPALDREIQRIQMEVDIAATLEQEAEFSDQLEGLKTLRRELVAEGGGSGSSEGN